MSKKNIQRNFEMSAIFTEYSIEHPEILRSIPKNAEIIIIPESEDELAKENRALGHRITKLENKPVMQAIQSGKTWKLEPLNI